MDVSARTDYAVRALLMLAEAQHSNAGLKSAVWLAEQQRLPVKFLEAILTDLKRAGLLESRRGQSGGHLLARPASQIMVGDVFRAVDGPLAEVRGQRPQDTTYTGVAEHLPTVWVATRAALRRVLDEVSIEAVLTGELPEHVVGLANAPDAWRNR